MLIPVVLVVVLFVIDVIERNFILLELRLKVGQTYSKHII
jgi:hypothetical protein